MGRLLSRRGARDALLGAALALCTLGLLRWPQQSMEAAKAGLQLCYNVIIPSLFPFFVLSTLVVELGLAGYIGRVLEGVMRPVFHVPGCCACAVVLGFLGGYPVGARTALSLYEKGLCTKTEAERLLAFCNNSGPAFILGVVGAGIFSSSRVGLLLYLTHAAASVCVGVLFRFYRRGEQGAERHSGADIQAKRLSGAFTGAVKSALSSALHICAYVVLFTVVIQLLTVSGALPALAYALSAAFSPLGLTEVWSRRLLTGLLEISSGVWTLAGEGALAGRLPMAAFMLGWAGLSVHSQVLSFLEDSGLSPRTYLVGKLLHGGLSALLTCALVRLLPLDAQVGAYLTEQVESLAALDLSTALTVSTAAAWAVWLAFFAVAAAAIRGKRGGKRGGHGV